MQKLLLIAAAFGASAAPAVAQTAPAPSQPVPPQPAQAAPAQPKTVTKLVCRDVEEERSIGSRLASTTKICRKVVVPAPVNGQQQPQQPSRDGSR